MAKFSGVSILLCATLAVSCYGAVISPRITDEHNIDSCDTPNAKVVLLETNVYEEEHFLGIVKRTVNYPDTTVSQKVITCIKVTNADTSDHGGYPKIVSGGVGSTDVQILLTSQLGQPLNFRIEIWAAK